MAVKSEFWNKRYSVSEYVYGDYHNGLSAVIRFVGKKTE